MESGRQSYITVTGIILSSQPIGEYDRRIVLLTKEKGKISCFARGARRQGSTLMSAGSFCFGTYRIYASRNSYVMVEAQVRNFFRTLAQDVEGALYGSYFLEVMDYVTRENNDETQLLILLYQSLRALEAENIDNRLVRAVFEIKTVMLEGEFPMPDPGAGYSEGTFYSVRHIGESRVSALYTFTVSEQVLAELEKIAASAMKRSLGHKFVSLDILKAML